MREMIKDGFKKVGGAIAGVIASVAAILSTRAATQLVARSVLVNFVPGVAATTVAYVASEAAVPVLFRYGMYNKPYNLGVDTGEAASVVAFEAVASCAYKAYQTLRGN
jgi:hypothetical protein